MSDIDSKSKKKFSSALAIITFVVVAIVIATLFSFSINNKQEYTTSNNISEHTISLYCSAKSPVDAFFESQDDVISSEHKIKAIFEDESSLSKIAYTLSSTYKSNDAADLAGAKLHAKFNLYLSDSSINPELYFPTFSATDSELHINIYSDKDNLNSTINRIIFFDDTVSGKYDIKTLKNLYSRKGFTCSINN